MTTSGVSCMTSDTAKSPATLEPKLSDTRVGGGHRACLTGEGVPLIQAECPPPLPGERLQPLTQMMKDLDPIPVLCSFF